ncbi:hypothetical protein [Sphingopyxis terrae]|uniref:hypothetical protein n=1 Tax=Sphingopyxis terrae TaxID=33052 RepID=UPI001055F6AB|nr:hypothetical protein [Sphingopyxis terrae]
MSMQAHFSPATAARSATRPIGAPPLGASGTHALWVSGDSQTDFAQNPVYSAEKLRWKLNSSASGSRLPLIAFRSICAAIIENLMPLPP